MAKTVRKKTSSDRILKTARERCGFESLRPGQREAIESVLAQHDTLVVQPTGSGKSAIYQIAAALIPGPTVVVSPLIALQKDQVDAIGREDVGEAALVNSTVPISEVRETFEKLEDGALEFLFVAPEQFHNPETLEHIREAKPLLFVVDEAHCISEWGHDFRPDYLNLGAAIEALNHPTVLALTATAAPRVRDEITARLGLRDPRVFVHGFDRPNIWLGVHHAASESEKREALAKAVDGAEKPGIIYTATRRHAEEVGTALSDRGLRVSYYHGGMRARERHRVQEEFMQGGSDVIVATNAFGMGVDKPDVRFVFHYDIPDSIDSYYQEIGRAGRDGKPSRALLFYRPEDLAVQKFFKGGGKLDESMLRGIVQAMIAAAKPIGRKELEKQTGLTERKLARAVSRLKETGAIDERRGGTLAINKTADLQVAVHEAAEAQQRHKDDEQLRVEKMRRYAELSDCRREYVLEYFGELAGTRCDNCDNCHALEQKQQSEPNDAARRFPPNSRGVRPEWGEGEVA